MKFIPSRYFFSDKEKTLHVLELIFRRYLYFITAFLFCQNITSKGLVHFSPLNTIALFLDSLSIKVSHIYYRNVGPGEQFKEESVFYSLLILALLRIEEVNISVRSISISGIE